MSPNLHRRQHARITASMPAEFAPDGETQRTGRVIDLGAGGMRLMAGESLSPGTAIDIRFILPGSDKEVRVRGRVLLGFYSAEEKTYSHGIVFTAIGPEDKKMLEDFVDEQVVR